MEMIYKEGKLSKCSFGLFVTNPLNLSILNVKSHFKLKDIEIIGI